FRCRLSDQNREPVLASKHVATAEARPLDRHPPGSSTRGSLAMTVVRVIAPPSVARHYGERGRRGRRARLQGAPTAPEILLQNALHRIGGRMHSYQRALAVACATFGASV